MPYITTAERIGWQNGHKEGVEQGIGQGIEQGEQNFLLELLQYKFAPLPEAYRKRVEHADESTLLKWGKKVLEAKTLEDVFV